MLKPHKGQPRTHEIVAYDLEWWPETYELRLVGAYDARRGYRAYTSLAAFFARELSPANTRRRFYAHFGGSSDLLFLAQHVIRECPAVRVDLMMSGSSAVIAKVTRGGRRWTFVDSAFLIKRPLEEIGTWLGLSKGDKKAITSEDENELREYNERDCRILYEAVTRLQSEINAHGGELRVTLAATALDLFRRRFLRRTIEVRDDVNEFARRAYTSSRVEVIRRECPRGDYYDINSSFPASMVKAQPARMTNVGTRLPTRANALYLAECTVRVKPCYLGPVPYRAKNGPIFPTGAWSAVFDAADVELLQERGHAIEKVHRVMTFEPFDDLAAYVAELFERKNACADGSYEREVWKLLLNALYGKFAERGTRWQLFIHPACTTCEHSPACSEDDPCVRMLGPGVWAKRIEREIAHAHAPISVHVTALSRRLLFDSLAACALVYYCDTDSVVCGPDDRLPTSRALGALKHEYTLRDGRFLAPKLYSFETDHEGQPKRVTRAKGFSRLDYAQFCALAEGRDVVVSRMMRLRESLAHDGTITPRDVTQRKHARLLTTKRRFLPCGNSEPWDVASLSETA